MPGKSRRIKRRLQRDIHDVVILRLRAVTDTGNRSTTGNDSLGEKKAGRELEITTRRPHCNGDAVTVDADFEGLLDRDGIRPLPAVALANSDARRRTIHVASFSTRTMAL